MRNGAIVIAFAVIIMIFIGIVRNFGLIDNELAKIHETVDSIEMYRQETEELKKEIAQLESRIGQYEQDIQFWNKQVNSMFGEHNARYFKEGRDK